MDVLIIGGTVFLGRHVAEAALARGHRVTLFSRGRHNPDLFDGVEKLRGDRTQDLSALDGRRWDAVVDMCGYVPRHVGAMARRLAGAVGHYTFVSTISVYADPSPARIDEGAPVGALDDPATETVDGRTYGPLKALCEAAAEAELPGRVFVPRPGLIVGPHDPTDRFTYWPLRVARSGRFAAPVGPDLPVQIVDARDLADWMVRMVEAGEVGIYNAVGPAEPLTMGDVVAACQAAAPGGATPVWIPEAVLAAHAVGAYVELPLWLPASAGGLATVDAGRAIARGLTFRPLAATVADTLEWARTRPADHPLGAGLSPEREAELLAAVA